MAVTNAGVSGETAADGLARYDWSVPAGTDALLVELGANDMLRGLPPERAEAALAEILQRAKKAHVATLLLGMRAAPNFGADYQRADSMRSIPRSPRATASRYIRSSSTASPTIPN